MTTNNHPAHGPVSIDRLHQISEILSKAAAQSDGGNLGYAMADAVKVINGAIASFLAEPVGEIVLGENDDCGSHPDAKVVCIAADGQADWENFSDGTRLYAVPPAPVSIDERAAFNAWNNDENLPIAGVGAKNAAWLAWQARAAMLQAGNHTEQRLDMVEHSDDANENVDCRLPFEQWLSQQNEPIDVDCGCVTTEAFYHWLRVAYEDGNSPVTPDCWCRTCRPVTMSDMRFVVCPECGNKRCPHANDHRNDCTGSNEPGQVDSAYPASPNQ